MLTGVTLFCALIAVPTSTSSLSETASAARAREALERELAAELAPAAEPEPSGSSAPSAATPGRATVRLIDIAFDLLAAGGYSSAEDPEIQQLEAGGHDPKQRGFTVQNVELTFSGVVDPYVRGDANIVLQIDPSGETIVELEEAYLTTLALPYHLQLKAGHFFGAFGRHNPMHPHAWSFVDQPVVASRFLGPDGFRNPGAQLSWLAPVPFFLELTASAQNARGETAFSFFGNPEESFAGRPLLDLGVKSAADLAYLARVVTSVDLREDLPVMLGFSGLFGPNATERGARTEVYGADLYAKWKPLENEQGWPFVALQAEVMLRRYEAGPLVLGIADGLPADDTVAVPGAVLFDHGLYVQLVLGLLRPWVAAVRYDYAAAEASDFDLSSTRGVPRSYRTSEDPLRDLRHRVSGALTYYPTEFSKVRLQYQHDRARFLAGGSAHSVYLQAEINFGAHGAHKF